MVQYYRGLAGTTQKRVMVSIALMISSLWLEKILLTVSPPCIDFYNMGSSKVVAPNKIETITDPLPLDGVSLQNTPNLPRNMHLGFNGCENTYGNIYTQIELQRLVKGKWETYCRGSMNTINTKTLKMR